MKLEELSAERLREEKRRIEVELSKRHKTKDDEINKQLIYELSKMPPMVLSTAYIYAKNYVNYGVDVTEKWITATQNASALERAYRKGYCDALQKPWIKEEEDV